MNTAKTFTPETAIIAHGDGDGTIAAAICRKAGAGGALICTQPFLLHKLSNLTGPTVIVDIAVDNKNPEATLEWARRNSSNIVAWVDHHLGGEGLTQVLGNRFVYNPKAPSCPATMYGNGFTVPYEWLNTANACDRPTEFKSTELSVRYNSAFKVALVALQSGDRGAVDMVQTAFIDELATGVESALVTERVSAYPALEAATKLAVAQLTELAPEVGFVNIEGGQASADITQVFMGGYQKFPIVVIMTTSATNGEQLTIVGTNKKADELNLVDTFGLGSGNPSRVVLTGIQADLDYIKSRLTPNICPHCGSDNCAYLAGVSPICEPYK